MDWNDITLFALIGMLAVLCGAAFGWLTLRLLEGAQWLADPVDTRMPDEPDAAPMTK